MTLKLGYTFLTGQLTLVLQVPSLNTMTESECIFLHINYTCNILYIRAVPTLPLKPET